MLWRDDRSTSYEIAKLVAQEVRCRIGKPALWRRLVAIERLGLESRTCVAVVAVFSELVSAPNSLLTGKITGKNHDFGAVSRHPTPSNPNAVRAVEDSVAFVAEN
jgi:hypothetical protein